MPISGIVRLASLGTTGARHPIHTTSIGTAPNSAGVPYSAGIADWHIPALQGDHSSLLASLQLHLSFRDNPFSTALPTRGQNTRSQTTNFFQELEIGQTIKLGWSTSLQVCFQPPFRKTYNLRFGDETLVIRVGISFGSAINPLATFAKRIRLSNPCDTFRK